MIKTEKEKKVFINNFNLILKRKSLRDTFKKKNKINTKYSISKKTIVYFFYKHSIS